MRVPPRLNVLRSKKSMGGLQELRDRDFAFAQQLVQMVGILRL